MFTWNQSELFSILLFSDTNITRNLIPYAGKYLLRKERKGHGWERMISSYEVVTYLFVHLKSKWVVFGFAIIRSQHHSKPYSFHMQIFAEKRRKRTWMGADVFIVWSSNISSCSLEIKVSCFPFCYYQIPTSLETLFLTQANICREKKEKDMDWSGCFLRMK